MSGNRLELSVIGCPGIRPIICVCDSLPPMAEWLQKPLFVMVLRSAVLFMSKLPVGCLAVHRRAIPGLASHAASL